MSTKANEPAGEETGKVTGIPEQTVAANEEATGVTGEQPLATAEGALGPTSALPHQDVPGKQQPSTGRKSRRGILRKWLVGAAAAVGAGALLKANTGIAHADGNEGPTVFTAVNTAQPAVKAISQTQVHWAIESTGPIGIITYSDEVQAPYPPGGVAGLVAASNTGYAIYATGAHGGPLVYSTNNDGLSGSVGVQGTSSGSGTGVIGTSDSSIGVQGTSKTGTGVEGTSNGSGLSARGVNGMSASGIGVVGSSTDGLGVAGTSDTGIAVLAVSKGGLALRVVGHMQVWGDSVGQAILPAGNTAVTVTTAAATLSSNILLTPLGNPNGSLWVTRANGSFTINAGAAQGSNLPIAYLIIN
jgi:hypothetical protein